MSISNAWLLFALGSAFFAALTAILGKIGVTGLDADLATFVRTLVILFLTVGIVSLRHQWRLPEELSYAGLLALILSGVATGASWLCYYRALQLAPASRVAPVDKLSVAMVIVMAALFFGEPLNWKTTLGGILITTGAIILAF